MLRLLIGAAALAAALATSGSAADGPIPGEPVGATTAVEVWGNDVPAARARAASEGKDVLLFFTGSDWCPPCKRLHGEVLSKPEFLTATAGFVLVELDFPRRRELAPALTQANQALAEQYGITGFPTILLVDTEGRAYAKPSTQARDPVAFAAELLAQRALRTQRDTAFRLAAAATSPVEAARLLDAGLRALGPTLPIAGYAAEIDRIIAADPDGSLGLRAPYDLLRHRDLLAEMREGMAQAAVSEGATAARAILAKVQADDSLPATVKARAARQCEEACAIAEIMAEREEIQAALEAGKPDAALARIDRVSASGPATAVRQHLAAFFRGMILAQSDRPAEAVAELRRAQALVADGAFFGDELPGMISAFTAQAQAAGSASAAVPAPTGP